jgi:hypothetical protein
MCRAAMQATGLLPKEVSDMIQHAVFAGVFTRRGTYARPAVDGTSRDGREIKALVLAGGRVVAPPLSQIMDSQYPGKDEAIRRGWRISDEEKDRRRREREKDPVYAARRKEQHRERHLWKLQNDPAYKAKCDGFWEDRRRFAAERAVSVLPDAEWYPWSEVARKLQAFGLASRTVDNNIRMLCSSV